MASIYNNDPNKVSNPPEAATVAETRAAEMDLTYDRLAYEAKVRSREYILARLPPDHHVVLMERLDADFPPPTEVIQPPVDAAAAIQAAAHRPAQEAADAKAEELKGTPLVPGGPVEVHPTDVQPAPVQPPYPADAPQPAPPVDPSR